MRSWSVCFFVDRTVVILTISTPTRFQSLSCSPLLRCVFKMRCPQCIDREGDRAANQRNSGAFHSRSPAPGWRQLVSGENGPEWRRLLRQSTTQGRTVLQRVLRGRITFTPTADGKGYRFHASTRRRVSTGYSRALPPSGRSGSRPRALTRAARTSVPKKPWTATTAVSWIEFTEKGWCALHDSNVRPPGS